jgi:hypothetical protein
MATVATLSSCAIAPSQLLCFPQSIGITHSGGQSSCAAADGKPGYTFILDQPQDQVMMACWRAFYSV